MSSTYLTFCHPSLPALPAFVIIVVFLTVVKICLRQCWRVVPFAVDVFDRQPSDRALVVAILVVYLIVSLVVAVSVYLIRRLVVSFHFSVPL